MLPLPAYDLPLLAERLRHAPPVTSPDEDVSAAVAIVLRERDGVVEVLLIERAVCEGDPWSGHMAFPGGRRDPGDVDALATAVRETAEEVGIDLATHGTFLARLSDVPVLMRGKGVDMRVAPFVFALHREVAPVHSEEVADTVWTPVAPLGRGERAGEYPFHWLGVDHVLPCYRLGERVVWGLTHMMFESMFEVLHRE